MSQPSHHGPNPSSYVNHHDQFPAGDQLHLLGYHFYPDSAGDEFSFDEELELVDWTADLSSFADGGRIPNTQDGSILHDAESAFFDISFSAEFDLNHDTQLSQTLLGDNYIPQHSFPNVQGESILYPIIQTSQLILCR